MQAWLDLTFQLCLTHQFFADSNRIVLGTEEGLHVVDISKDRKYSFVGTPSTVWVELTFSQVWVD